MMHRLPIKLQARVISFFDLETIQNFLVAFPHFQDHTLLITDHEHEPNYFGTIDRRRFGRVIVGQDRQGHMKVTRSIKKRTEVNKCFIKLVEITHYDMFTAWTELIDAGVDPEATPPTNVNNVLSFDTRTFVFIHGYNASTTDMFRLRRAIIDQQKTTWFMGLPPYPASAPSRHVGPHDQLSGSTRQMKAENLVSLRVEGADVFAGHELPALRHLVVDFSHIQNPSSENRGSIKHLTLPSLLTLTVNYRRIPPVFCGLSVCRKVNESSPEYRASASTPFYLSLHRGEPVPHTVFELTDVDVCGDSWPLAPGSYDTPEFNFASSDLSFVAYFAVLSFNGVPSSFMAQCDLSQVQEVRFTVKHPTHFPTRDTMRRITLFISILITNFCDNWTVPFLDSIEWNHISETQILSCARNTDLSEVLCQGNLRRDGRTTRSRVERLLIHISDPAGWKAPFPFANEEGMKWLRIFRRGRLGCAFIHEASQFRFNEDSEPPHRQTRTILQLLTGHGNSLSDYPPNRHWKTLRSWEHIDHKQLWPLGEKDSERFVRLTARQIEDDILGERQMRMQYENRAANNN